MPKRGWLTMAMAVLVTGSLAACAGDEGYEGGGGGGDRRQIDGSFNDTGRTDSGRGTADDAGMRGGTTVEEPLDSGRAP